MDLWYIWILVGIILIIVEILTPGFIIGTFGISALFTGSLAYLGISLKFQLLIFSILSLVIFFGIRPFFMKLLYSKNEVKTNYQRIIGKKGTVEEKIDNKMNKGRVYVGSEDWKAYSYDDSIIEKGEEVEILKIEGNKVIVRRI